MSFTPQPPSNGIPSASTPLVSSPQPLTSTSQSSTSCFSCCCPSTASGSNITKNSDKKPAYTGEIKQNRLKTRDQLVARTACCCISLSFLGEAEIPDCCGAGHYFAFCCAELYFQYGLERVVTGSFLPLFF